MTTTTTTETTYASIIGPCPGWCPGPEQHHRSTDGSIELHELRLPVEGTDMVCSVQQNDNDPNGRLQGPHVALPSGDEMSADDALDLGAALMAAFDIIRNAGVLVCSPVHVDPDLKCVLLATATVVLPGWVENFTELNYAVRSAANSGAIPTHVHEGRLHCLEADVLKWHVSQP